MSLTTTIISFGTGVVLGLIGGNALLKVMLRKEFEEAAAPDLWAAMQDEDAPDQDKPEDEDDA